MAKKEIRIKLLGNKFELETETFHMLLVSAILGILISASYFSSSKDISDIYFWLNTLLFAIPVFAMTFYFLKSSVFTMNFFSPEMKKLTDFVFSNYDKTIEYLEKKLYFIPKTAIRLPIFGIFIVILFISLKLFIDGIFSLANFFFYPYQKDPLSDFVIFIIGSLFFFCYDYVGRKIGWRIKK